MQRVRAMTSVVTGVAHQRCKIGVEPFTLVIYLFGHLTFPETTAINNCTSRALTTPSPFRSACMFGTVPSAALIAMSTSALSTLPSPFRSHGLRVTGGQELCCVGLGLLSEPGGPDGGVVTGATIGSAWVCDSRCRSASFKSFPSCRTSAWTDPSLVSDVPTVVRISFRVASSTEIAFLMSATLPDSMAWCALCFALSYLSNSSLIMARISSAVTGNTAGGAGLGIAGAADEFLSRSRRLRDFNAVRRIPHTTRTTPVANRAFASVRRVSRNHELTPPITHKAPPTQYTKISMVPTSDKILFILPHGSAGVCTRHLSFVALSLHWSLMGRAEYTSVRPSPPNCDGGGGSLLRTGGACLR